MGAFQSSSCGPSRPMNTWPTIDCFWPAGTWTGSMSASIAVSTRAARVPGSCRSACCSSVLSNSSQAARENPPTQHSMCMACITRSWSGEVKAHRPPAAARAVARRRISCGSRTLQFRTASRKSTSSLSTTSKAAPRRAALRSSNVSLNCSSSPLRVQARPAPS